MIENRSKLRLFRLVIAFSSLSPPKWWIKRGIMYQAESEQPAEEKPNKCKICLYYTWKLFSCIISHIFLVSLVIAYCYLGAYVFELLEAKHEVQVKKKIPSIRVQVIDDIWNMTQNAQVLNQQNWSSYVRLSLQGFETKLLTAMKKDGWDGTEGDSATQWTFTGSLFYSIIVITTIGYGHIAPKTSLGKVVTIFYAILGIPLMLLCLSNIGDIMAHSFRFLYWRVCCYMCTRKPKRQPSRRGRGRGTIRSSSGNRLSNRSRGQSFRHPNVRTSTRSADSALGLSLSTYSENDNRYYEDRETNLDSNHLRASQHSRYSDSAVPVRTGDVIPPFTPYRTAAEPSDTTPVPTSTPTPTETQIPVLINKYALDRNESMKAQRPEKYSQSSSTLPKQKPHHHQYYPNTQLQNLPYAGSLRRQQELDFDSVPSHSNRSSKRVASSSPRVMSPMGFAVPRQPSYRSQRLSRLREDNDFDFEYDYDDGEQSGGKIKPVPIWLCVCLVISYIIGGAYLFHNWEKWNILDAAYFCFITLTTIGFGDFVPAQKVTKDAEISIALCSLYLLFGIALLAMSFNLVQEEVINNVKSVAKRLGIIKDDDEDD